MASKTVPITCGTAYTVLVYSLERLQLERERRGMTSDLSAERQPPETVLREGPCVHRREEIGGALLRYLAERIMVYQHKLH